MDVSLIRAENFSGVGENIGANILGNHLGVGLDSFENPKLELLLFAMTVINQRLDGEADKKYARQADENYSDDHDELLALWCGQREF